MGIALFLARNECIFFQNVFTRAYARYGTVFVVFICQRDKSTYGDTYSSQFILCMDKTTVVYMFVCLLYSFDYGVKSIT